MKLYTFGNVLLISTKRTNLEVVLLELKSKITLRRFPIPAKFTILVTTFLLVTHILGLKLATVTVINRMKIRNYYIYMSYIVP